MIASKNTSIDKYIKKFPEDIQKLLEKVRECIKVAIPNSTEGISYGIPTFYINDKYLIYFAGFKKHISIYPATTSAVEKSKLTNYQVSKGTLRFPTSSPIPYKRITKFAEYRLKEHKSLQKNRNT